MSELKATVLGIVLTLTLFAAVSAILTAAFNIYNDKVKEEVKEVTGEDIVIINMLTY